MGWKARACGLALAAGALTATAGIAGPKAPAMDVGRARAAFTVDVPEGCTLENGPTQATFAIFYVRCEGRVYAGVYAGNEADPNVPHSRLMLTENRWPAQVQAWSLDVPGDQARADAIAASVRVRRVKIAWA